MSDYKKFKEKLPCKAKFPSLLLGKNTSDNKYEHSVKIWSAFQMETMKNYHDLYLKRDVLLLADVVVKIRNNSLKNYGSCPSHY